MKFDDHEAITNVSAYTLLPLYIDYSLCHQTHDRLSTHAEEWKMEESP